MAESIVKNTNRRIQPNPLDAQGAIPRTPNTVRPEATHYSFYFHCFCGLSAVVGGALVLFGIMTANPLLFVTGLGGIALGTCAWTALHGFFAKVPEESTILRQPSTLLMSQI
ncbi:MAG: hypothetical protein WC785_04325 [Tatlockia sp.]|jgi:hypothetical protein